MKLIFDYASKDADSCDECGYPFEVREKVYFDGDYHAFCSKGCAITYKGRERKRMRDAVQECIRHGDCPACGSDLVHWAGNCPCGGTLGWKPTFFIDAQYIVRLEDGHLPDYQHRTKLHHAIEWLKVHPFNRVIDDV